MIQQPVAEEWPRVSRQTALKQLSYQITTRRDVTDRYRHTISLVEFFPIVNGLKRFAPFINVNAKSYTPTLEFANDPAQLIFRFLLLQTFRSTAKVHKYQMNGGKPLLPIDQEAHFP
jgi:hypothetical protein